MNFLSPIPCEGYWTHQPTPAYSCLLGLLSTGNRCGKVMIQNKTLIMDNDNGFKFPYKNCSLKVVLFSKDLGVKAAKSTDESTDEFSLTNSFEEYWTLQLTPAYFPPEMGVAKL
jgi:hypothetical protein